MLILLSDAFIRTISDDRADAFKSDNAYAGPKYPSRH